jgi:hypothetical protein
VHIAELVLRIFVDRFDSCNGRSSKSKLLEIKSTMYGSTDSEMDTYSL